MKEIVQYVNLASGEILPFSITKNNEYISTECNADDIVKLINVPNIAPRYKIYVLYPDETINYEIPIEDIKPGGNYNENYQNGTRRSLSFTLDNTNGKYTSSLDKIWIGDRLKFEQGLDIGNDVIIWFHKGVFVVETTTPSMTIGDNSITINAQDKFSLFEGKGGTLDSTYEIPYGTDIQSLISSILLHSNGNDIPYDTQPIIYHSSFQGKKTQVTISKNAGETYGSILLELATQLSAEIFYNSLGYLTLTPLVETTTDDNKPLIFEFDSSKGDISNLNFTFNMNEIINRVIVVGSSKDKGVTKAIAVNDDPSSPLCVQRIGYRTGPIINDSNISNVLLAQDRANYELRKQLILKSSTNVSILFNPLLEVNNLVSITDTFFKLIQERFLISSLSFPIDYSGTMSMTITNIENLNFLI